MFIFVITFQLLPRGRQAEDGTKNLKEVKLVSRNKIESYSELTLTLN